MHMGQDDGLCILVKANMRCYNRSAMDLLLESQKAVQCEHPDFHHQAGLPRLLAQQ